MARERSDRSNLTLLLRLLRYARNDRNRIFNLVIRESVIRGSDPPPDSLIPLSPLHINGLPGQQRSN
jgi:hypothetical protein